MTVCMCMGVCKCVLVCFWVYVWMNACVCILIPSVVPSPFSLIGVVQMLSISLPLITRT